jgi:hypothetical protein
MGDQPKRIPDFASLVPESSNELDRYARGADLGLDAKRARRLQPGPNWEIVDSTYLRKRLLEAAISPTKAIAKSEIVGPLSGASTGGGPNINGIAEIDKKSDRSILDFMV